MNGPAAIDEKTSSGDKEAPPPVSAFMQQLASRGTVRDFKPDPVPQSWADAIVEMGMRAPTSSNRQEYSVIQVDDADKRKKLAELCANQKHIVECPVFFAVCADQNRVERALAMHGQAYDNFGLEGGLVATIDATLVGLTMSYVADSMGLSTVLIGAMRNHPVEVARLLGLPPRCYCVFGLCVGWAKPPLRKPRHNLAAVLHHDTYSAEAHVPAIEDYDRDLAAYYRQRGDETVDAAWSEVISQKFRKPRRTGLRAELKSLGFPFE